MLLKIRQIIQRSPIDHKQIIQLGIDIFVYPFIDEAKKDISIVLRVSFFKDYIGMPLRFSE